MFTRTHRIGRYDYIEALESYRDPETGKPRHRCVVRWRAERSFAEELGRTHFEIEHANEKIAYWQGLIDRTGGPRFPKQTKRAPEALVSWRRRLQMATSHFAALTEARNKGLRANDSEIEQAVQVEASRCAALRTRATSMSSRPARAPDLAVLADRLRRLITQNDLDAVRAELAEIATALEALR
jgi:hypothetical protein